MCSCANECVHVGPISTFDLNNSNSGVAQISNRACDHSGLKLLVIEDTDHMYLPAPSFSMCFSYSAVWDEMNRKLAVVILSVGWKHVFKAEIIGFQQYCLNFSDWPAVGHDGGVHQGAVAHDHHLRHRQLLQRDVCVHAGDHLHCDL